MIFTSALEQPSGKLIIAAQITAGAWLRAWVSAGANSVKIPWTTAPYYIAWDGDLGTTLTKGTSAANVEATASSWYWDGSYVYVRPPGGQTVYSHTLQAIMTLWMSNHPRYVNVLVAPATLEDRFHDPRIESIPNLSQRIEAIFGGVGQVGGGNLTLTNSDGYFDDKLDWQWDARSVSIQLALDVPGSTASTTDFSQAGVWIVDEWSRTETQFVLRLKEPKTRIKSDFPTATYTRANWPNINDQDVGQIIPTVYGQVFGVKPTLVDPGTKRYKVASHAITSLDAVRIKQTKDVSSTTNYAALNAYSGTTLRTYIPNVAVKSVRNGGSTLTSVTSVTDCLATSSSWVFDQNFLYVNVAALTSLDVDYTVQVKSWQTANFVTTSLSLGEFTLGNDVKVDDEVSVDLTGKLDGSGMTIGTGPGIIQDILTTAGETAINTGSFTAAAAAYQFGTLDNGLPNCRLCIGVNLSDAKQITDIIAKICGQTGCYVYTDASGNYFCGSFAPVPTPNVYDIRDVDILEYTDLMTVESIESKFLTSYQDRKQDGYPQQISYEITDIQRIHNQPLPIVDDEVLPFATSDDATLYAQRWLQMHAVPLRKFTITLFWRAWKFNLGDQVSISFVKRGIYGKFEVLERNVDLKNHKVKLVLGDMRGMGDRVGWWVSSPTLPTSFASLAGYGSGDASTWNSAWDAEIKRWARSNVGYWTDANGFASSTDPDSFIPSSWF